MCTYTSLGASCLIYLLLYGYPLNIQDRHNGNLLIDDAGHLVHIDFGFLLGISPGGNLGFETAAFKLSQEMVDLMGGVRSHFFKHVFVDSMCVRAFLAARQLVSAIVILAERFGDSGLPCFCTDLRILLFSRHGLCLI